MDKIAFIFPGQGSQYVGMAKDIYDAYPVVKKLYATAGENPGFRLGPDLF